MRNVIYDFEDKKMVLDNVVQRIQLDLPGLHPLDIPIALREVAKWCEDEADKHDVANDFNGVPER